MRLSVRAKPETQSEIVLRLKRNAYENKDSAGIADDRQPMALQ